LARRIFMKSYDGKRTRIIRLKNGRKLIMELENKNQSKRIKQQGLSGITKIIPRIHRLALTGDYSYEDLSKQLGSFSFVKNTRRRPKYKDRGNAYLNKENLTLFFNSLGYIPHCLIELTYEEFETLVQLNQLFPNLSLSSVEYAIDFLCKGPEEVANLFYALWLYSYFPNKANPYFKGGKFQGWGEPREENLVYKLSRSVKIYERGLDSRQRNDYSWLHEHVNRVRVEITLSRKELVGHKLLRLNDLIDDSKMTEIFSDKIRFITFSRSDKLPNEFWDFYLKDKANKIELINYQGVVNLAEEIRIKNIAQYVIDAPGFDNLKSDIRVAIKGFNKKWIKKRKLYFKAKE
jgi:hypothetical protein